MYLVTPDEAYDDELGSWEGSIKRMMQVHEKSMMQLDNSISLQMSELHEQID